jgi:hypothetical protein
VVHQAASRHDWVLCGTSGCKSISIGYSGTLWYVRLQVDMIGYFVVHQAAGQYPSGTLKAGAVHQAVR